MQATNCPKCGRLFRKIRVPVCPDCEKLEEEQFQQLRAYLEENPLASIHEISDATGVPTKRILHYMREGRLEITQGLSGLIHCTQCGAPIEKGKFCEPCSAKMQRNLSESLGAPAGKLSGADLKRGSGMHTR